MAVNVKAERRTQYREFRAAYMAVNREIFSLLDKIEFRAAYMAVNSPKSEENICITYVFKKHWL